MMFFLNFVKKFSLIHQFHYNKYKSVIFKIFENLNYMRMINHFHNLYFFHNFLLFLLCTIVFENYFYCSLLMGLFINNLPDFSICSTSKNVIRNLIVILKTTFILVYWVWNEFFDFFYYMGFFLVRRLSLRCVCFFWFSLANAH